MKAEFLNPFVYAGLRVLMTEAGVTHWSLDKPFLSRIDATRHPASVVIGVAGAVQGLVIYGMDAGVAKRIVRAMAGTAIPLTDPLAKSALGELGNMVTGLASRILEECGYPCRISPPAIVRGTATRLTCASIPMISVPLVTDIGVVHILLGLAEVEKGRGNITSTGG